AETQLVPTIRELFTTEDAALGVQAFLTRTTAEFVGR
ncbi:MAG: crotonase/enoyl-CoA hydratase family protein, partial [[Mycobacterium] stephanolepidis]